MIAYRAMLDVPREAMLAGRLRTERRARGTRKRARALTCWKQALMVLVWYRKREDMTVLAAGFGISRATAYRYRDEATTVLAEAAPDLHEALARVAEEGWSHVVLDGKLFRSDRVAATTTSRKGETINSWYSGKHHQPGGLTEAIMRPDGFPIWLGDAAPGHRHDMAVARADGVLGALYWAASQLDLPTLADSGYEGAGQGVYTPIKQAGRGQVLAPDNQAYNALLRRLRCQGERGFALLVGRWRTLQHIIASPSKISDLVQAALVLTHFEHGYLRPTR